MKIKFKLSIMVIIIVAVAVGGVSILLLWQASNISIDLNVRSIGYLNQSQANYWKGREDNYIRAATTLAGIMADFESIPVAERRDRYDSLLLSTLVAETSFVTVYTVWKPNALDGMDSTYIGRVGSSSTGQYATAFDQDFGQVNKRVSVDIENTITHLNGPNGRKQRVDHPVSQRINGQDAYTIRMVAPIINTRNNEIVGGVGVILNIAGLQPALEEIIRNHDEIEAMVVYSGNGFILGSYRPERVGRMLTEVDTIYGDNMQAANQAVLNGAEFTGSSYAPTLRTNVRFNIMSFAIGNSTTTWSIMIATAESHILAEVNIIRRFTVILAVVISVISAIIVFIVLHLVTKPIVTVTNTLKDISEGEGDLTRRVVVNSKDEIGSLALYFNNTLEKIKNLVVTIKKEAESLSDTGNELASNMAETAAAVNEITSNIQSIKHRIINQSASVTETNSTMEQITGHIKKLHGLVENQSNDITVATSSIGNMVTNIQSVTQALVDNTENVEGLRNSSEVGRNGLQEVAADIQEIARQSEGLLEINSVMQNIASKTDLLSMNAAIEAAHAGEVGKGFAVVADEIRKLAESSSEQSKTIGIVLKKIKESIDKITNSTQNVLYKFEAIDKDIKLVSKQEEDICNTMEAQVAGSKQIIDGISNVNETTRQVKQGSEEMLDGSKEVLHEGQNLEQVTEEISGSMSEMATGAEQINIAVNRINDISIKNRENILLLMKEVSRFKVE